MTITFSNRSDNPFITLKCASVGGLKLPPNSAVAFFFDELFNVVEFDIHYADKVAVFYSRLFKRFYYAAVLKLFLKIFETVVVVDDDVSCQFFHKSAANFKSSVVVAHNVEVAG